MKRYFLLKVLTFTSLPAWFGVLCFVHLFYWPYEGCDDPFAVFKTLVNYPGLLLPFVPLGIVMWRIIEICRGRGASCLQTSWSGFGKHAKSRIVGLCLPSLRYSDGDDGVFCGVALSSNLESAEAKEGG